MTIVWYEREFQAVLRWESATFDSGGGATVLGFRGPVLNPLDDAAQIIYDAAVDTLLPGMHEAITLSSVYCRNFTNSAEAGSGDAGGRTGDLAPPNTAVLLSYKSAGVGPRARGRSYWPGLLNDGDITDSGTIQTGRLASIETYFEDFFAAMVTAQFDQCILQNEEGDTLPKGPPSPPVVLRALRSKAATQRRRLRR